MDEVKNGILKAVNKNKVPTRHYLQKTPFDKIRESKSRSGSPRESGRIYEQNIPFIGSYQERYDLDEFTLFPRKEKTIYDNAYSPNLTRYQAEEDIYL